MKMKTRKKERKKATEKRGSQAGRRERGRGIEEGG